MKKDELFHTHKTYGAFMKRKNFHWHMSLIIKFWYLNFVGCVHMCWNMGRDEKYLVFNFRQKCDKKQKFEFLHTYTSMTNLKDKFLKFKLIGIVNSSYVFLLKNTSHHMQKFKWLAYDFCENLPFLLVYTVQLHFTSNTTT